MKHGKWKGLSLVGIKSLALAEGNKGQKLPFY